MNIQKFIKKYPRLTNKMRIRCVSHGKNFTQLEVVGYIKYKQEHYRYQGTLGGLGDIRAPEDFKGANKVSNNMEFILAYKNKAMCNLLHQCNGNLFPTVMLLIYQDVKKRIQRTTKVATDICECLLVPGNAWMRELLEDK